MYAQLKTISRKMHKVGPFLKSAHIYIPYSLDQILRILFISSPKFVRHLLIPVAVREAILRETVN